MTRWPQVKSYPSSPARWPTGLPGMGDEATWPATTGHSNDPRTDNIEAEAAMLCEVAEMQGKLIADFDEKDFSDAVVHSDDFDRIVAALQVPDPDPVALTALLVKARDAWAHRVAELIVGW